MKKKTTDQLLSEAFKNPKYSGRHIIIIGGKIHAKKTGSAKSQLLEKLIKKYPQETPLIAYIPKGDTWVSYNMIVDTGADYTILPLSDATDLGVDLEKDCQVFETRGIGGAETVYFLKRKIRIKIGSFESKIPVGFLSRDDVPELLGGQECLNSLSVLFSQFVTHFSTNP